MYTTVLTENAGIKTLENGTKFLEDYIEFLKWANEINVFSDSLSIRGLLTSYSRDDLWTWLSSEIERISKLFDDNGYEYDENIPTLTSD